MYLPEGEGMLVFKTAPPDSGTPPPVAPLKADIDWRRQAVETTVKRWLPFFQGEDALAEAEREWSDLFRDLPSVAADIPSKD
jgi:hypothetical protein